MSWLAVFLGGGIGSLMRFGVSKLSLLLFPTKLPLGTFLSNLISCLIIGLALGVFKDKMDSSENLYFLLIIGLCGGFSTFSTFSYESIKMMQDGMVLYAVLNVLFSVLFCFGIIYYMTKT